MHTSFYSSDLVEDWQCGPDDTSVRSKQISYKPQTKITTNVTVVEFEGQTVAQVLEIVNLPDTTRNSTFQIAMRYFPAITICMVVCFALSLLILIFTVFFGWPAIHPMVSLWAIISFGGMILVLRKAAQEIHGR